MTTTSLTPADILLLLTAARLTWALVAHRMGCG